MKHSFKLITLAAGAALSTALALPAYAIEGTQIYTSGAHFYKRVVTHDTNRITSKEEFVALPNAQTTVFLQPGTQVLVNASFDAESRCSEFGDETPSQIWCELRITIGGVEGSPQASASPDTFAFDSTDSGTEGTGSWESHAMSRHRCIRNTTNQVLAIPVNVDWKITNNDGDGIPEFWIDDSSLVVELARGCSVQGVPVPVDAAAAPAAAQ